MIKFLVRKLSVLAILVSLICPYFVASANAQDEYICEAKQNSKKELPLLSKECPIGKGLWGVTPREDRGLFWIQCGFLPEPVSLKQAKSLYSKISKDVWIKPESKGFRCLIGPYERYTVAEKELKKVRELKPYKDAFVRSVAGSENQPKVVEPKKTQTVVPKPPVVSKPKPKKQTKPSPQPAAVKAEVKSVPKSIKPLEPMKSTAVGMVVIRREAKIEDNYYAIPFLMEGDDQYYMEYGIGWNRLDYDKAKLVCESQQMRLLSNDEWKVLIDSTVMAKKQWPVHVPYWGEGKQGLFTSGKITQLTGTSLLNVVCVK